MRRPLVLGQRHSTPQPVKADIAPPEELSLTVMPPLPPRPTDDGTGDTARSPRWLPDFPTTQKTPRSRLIGSDHTRGSGTLPDPLEAWRREAGLRQAEARSLVHAGFSIDERHRWPLPDATARTVQLLPVAEKPVEPPPPGWTSLSFQPSGAPARHFWFQPIQSERDLRRLRHGLFLRDLAADLGMPESMPQIHPFFHRDGAHTVYGMLVRIDPGACPASDPSLATDSALQRRHGNALDWLAALCNLQLPPEELVWTLGHQGLTLRPLLPVAPAPVPGGLGLGTDIGPRTPPVISPDLALRVALLDLGKWTDPAYPFLDPVQREQFVERVRLSWETLSQVPQLSPEAESASVSPVDARARPLSPRNLRISRKSVFGKVRDTGPASPREPQERTAPDAADRLWKQLRTPEPSEPLPDLTVRDLLALSSQPGLSHRAVSAALHSGAGAHDILQAHRLQLPPSWPVLARLVLDARATELSRLPGSPDNRTLYDQLQHAHPLTQVAQTVRKAVEAQPMSPRSRSPKETFSPPARADASTFTQTLERHASALFAGNALSAAIGSARTFEECRAVLLPIDIQQKTRLREACDKARAALTALSDAVVQLDRAHDRALSPRAAEIVDQIRTRVEQQQHALDRLNPTAEALGRRIPDTLRRTPTAEDLLLLQAPGGPALDYQLHGLLAGWGADDILSAHQAGWPSWFMEWGPSFADASLRREHIAERMGKVLASINRVDPAEPAIRQRYADHMARNYLANEADGHPGNFSTGASWDHDGSFGITDAPGFSAAMPKVVSASVWAALQDGAWGAQRQRFEGLIQPAEIAAMEQRRQALIAAHNTKVLRVVDDTEWDTDEVAQAMGCTALDTAVAAFRQQTDAVETTGQARAEAVKALAATIDDLPADQLLAQHAGMWLRASLTVGAGQPAPTAFLDPDGWTAEIEKLAAEQDARSSAERPDWAQHLGGHFDGVTERHAEAIHNSQRTLKRVVDSLASYGTSTLLAATGDEPAYRKKAKAAVKLLEQLRRQLETGDKLEAKIELQRAIAAEIGSWNRMTELVAAHQARFPNTLAGVTVGELLTLEQVRLPQAELDGMLKPNRSRLPAIQREGPDVDDLQELIAARTHFAPQLPLAHFIVMKLASIPVNAHTVPDPTLSTEVADHELSRLGSGQTATVWQADLGSAIGAWAFKPEPGGTEVPDAGIDTGIQRLRPGERLGPNFTGRTVASAKAAAALGFDGAPTSKPVVFRDPSTGKLVYGAASRLVKGAMLQEAEGKPAVLTLDVATVDRLQALEEGERQTVIDRVARSMGFVSATWDGIGQNITLTPGTEFRRNLDWTDPDLRRSLADGALWAALTAQADNHAGNYMQTLAADASTQLVAIDNDVSAGAGVRHPMEAAAEYNRAAWVRHLQGGVYNPPRPNHITASVRRELLTLGATGLAQRYPLPARPEPTAETRKAHLQKFEGLIRDLETASRVPLGTGTTRAWQRRLTARGNNQTHAAGIPKVISQRMAQRLTALTEDQVRNGLFGGLGQAEQDAAWERTKVLQQMVRGQTIQPVKDTEWGSDRVRDLMGLNPKDLKRIAGEDLAYAARDPRNIGTPDGDRHRLEFGLAAAFALEEQMARQRAEQIRRGEKDPRGQPLVYQGPALFDREALNRQLQAEADKANEARRVRQREEQEERGS